MVVGFEELPINMQNNVKELKLTSIRQINVTRTGKGVELSVVGTDMKGFGFLKILHFFKEND